MSSTEHTAAPESEQPLASGVLDAALRRQLAEEDRQAWKNVCGELIAIVSGGLLLGILAVLICIRYLGA